MMGWQWHQLNRMQIICTLLQTDNHTSTSPLKFLQARCSSCHPTNSVKALKAADRAICTHLTHSHCLAIQKVAPVTHRIRGFEGQLKVDISFAATTKNNAKSNIGPSARTKYYTESESRLSGVSGNLKY